ncbi:MAG TPA: hypothetical protein VK807_00400 [Gemmatimonadaceae bacterium]|jgi:hypothetical protein|nr:hypothetical protein [Gemmatimonadaceae bacterium]
MSRLFVVSIIAAGTLAVTQASAQDCHGAPPAADSQLGAINAQFTTPEAGDSLTTGAADSLGAAIKAVIRLPSPVPIPAWMPTPGLSIPYVHGNFAFTIENDGKVGSIKVERSTLSHGLDSAFTNALAAVPPQSLGRKVKLMMLVSLNTHTSPPVMRQITTPDGHTYDAAHPLPDSLRVVPGKHYGPHTVNLDSLTVPVWPQLPAPELIRPGTAPRGYRGMVNAMVVFDEKGHTASVDVMNGKQADMLGPTRAALADMQVSPASLGGCPVKFVIVVPVMFGS